MLMEDKDVDETEHLIASLFAMSFGTEAERIRVFREKTGQSRATYYRRKAALQRSAI
jgi:hypothetical protein